MTAFELSLFEIADEATQDHDVLTYAPDITEQYAEMWREVEAFDTKRRIPTFDEVWNSYNADKFYDLYSHVESEISSFRNSGISGFDDSDDYTAKDRSRANRRKCEVRAKIRHRDTLINIGFRVDALTDADQTRRLSEIYGQNKWKKYLDNPKMARTNPNLSGKGCAYKKVV